MDYWVMIFNQIQNVQHPLRDADPTPDAKLDTSCSSQSLYYIPELISFTAVRCVVNMFVPLDILNCTKERQMVLRDDCHVLVIDSRHRLDVLRSLTKFTDVALPSIYAQISVMHISMEDEKFFFGTRLFCSQSPQLLDFRHFKGWHRLIDIFLCVMNHVKRLIWSMTSSCSRLKGPTSAATHGPAGLFRTSSSPSVVATPVLQRFSSKTTTCSV